MIKLHRSRKKSDLTETLRGKKLRKKLLDLLVKRIQFENNAIEKFKVTARWKPAKRQLVAESNGKCAFCEIEVPAGQHGDVEHYRPKSIYWWMAYTIDNYVLSCQICNQSKSDNFDIGKSKRVALGKLPKESEDAKIEEFLDQIVLDPSDINFDDSILGLKKLKQLEEPRLLNPYLDDVEKYFSWIYDEALQEVEVVAAEGLSNIEKKNAQYSIDLLSLNRPPIKRKRFQALARLIITIDLGATKDQITPLYLSDACEFTGMNKFHFSQMGSRR